jgi:hypothetical protein
MANITKENKIHFFIKDESCQNFVKIELESYMAIPQHDSEIRFKRIEDIRIFYHRDIENCEVASFKIDFGRNDCMYSSCQSVKELYKYQQSDTCIYNFKPASKEDYLALREKAFGIFLKHRMADYSKLEIGSEFPR